MGNFQTKITGNAETDLGKAYEMDALPSRQPNLRSGASSSSLARSTQEGPLAGLPPSPRRRRNSDPSARAAHDGASTPAAANRAISPLPRSASPSSTRGAYRFEMNTDASSRSIRTPSPGSAHSRDARSMASSEAASETRSQAESEAESDDLGGFASIPGEPMSALFARIGIAPSKRPFDPYAPDVSFHPASNLNQHLLLREVMSNGLAHVLHKDKPMFYGQASDVGPLLHALAEAAGDRALHPDFSMVVSPNWTDPDNALLLIVNKRAFADNVIKEYVAFGFEEPPSEEEVADIVHNMGTPTALEWLSPDLDAATFNHAAMGMALGMGIGNATSWATHQPLGRTMAMVREMQPALPSSGYGLPPQSYYDVPRSGAIANHHFENTFSLNDEMQQAYQLATQFHPGLTFQGFAYAQAMNRLFVTPTPEQQ